VSNLDSLDELRLILFKVLERHDLVKVTRSIVLWGGLAMFVAKWVVSAQGEPPLSAPQTPP
jgi:hypothetical protein